jgi:DNA relaxase NicK
MTSIIKQLRDDAARRDLASLERHQAEAVAVEKPPLTNRGGTPPLSSPLPRPEGAGNKTVLDWLAFTVRRPHHHLTAWATAVFPHALFSEAAHGIKGYPLATRIHLDGCEIGHIGHGAEHGRNMVVLSGEGCKRIPRTDYPLLRSFVEALNEDDKREDGMLPVLDRVKLTRVDIALDFFDGRIEWEDARMCYDHGYFTVERAPKAPLLNIIGKVDGDGNNLGRTMYVGSRKGSKMARIYEKGLQVFANLDEASKARFSAPGQAIWGKAQFAPDGTLAERWLRVEIEFKAADTVLSFDMLTMPDTFFAGAYPFCAEVLEVDGGMRPERVVDEAVVTLARVIKAMRDSYGNTMTTLLDLGLLPNEICEMVATGMPNQKLVKAGIVEAVKADPAFRNSIMARDEIPF